MRRWIGWLTGLALLASAASTAAIRESRDLADVLPLLEEGTWVVLDLDHVLLTGPSGADWARVRKEIFAALKAAPEGEGEKAWDRAADLADLSPLGSEARALEPETAEIVAAIQRRAPMLVLTSRGIHLNRWTLRQLRALAIDPEGAAPVRATGEHYFGWNLLFQQGVIYAHSEGVDKGETLLKFLDHAGLKPERVVFVDDRSRNVTAVERALHRRHIRVEGLWYTRSHLR